MWIRFDLTYLSFVTTVVFDVFIDSSLDKVWLVDFAPFAPMTDSLLFSWDEIMELAANRNPDTANNNTNNASSSTSSTTPSAASTDGTQQQKAKQHLPVVRVLESEAEIRIYLGNRYPVDIIDVSSSDAIDRFADMMRSMATNDNLRSEH